MIKEIIEENGSTIISCGPENNSEMVEWYGKCYQESIEFYKKILNEILLVDKVQCFFTVCLGEYVNKLYQKQFPIRFLSSNYIPIARTDYCLEAWKSNTYMIAFSEINHENMGLIFSEELTSCLYFHAEDNLCEVVKPYFFPKKNAELLFEHYACQNNYFIEFNNIGCDGNSLIFHHSDNPLIKQIISNHLIVP